MSKKYCFNIINTDNQEIDIDSLKKFVEKLYIGKTDDKFSNDEKIPFVSIHEKNDDNLCIVMTSRGKKNIEKVENINKKLKKTPNKLKYTENISLGKPFEFIEEIDAWWKVQDKIADGKKWSSIVQRGPYFTHLMTKYEPIGASLIYEGKKYKLTPEEEKVAILYGKRKISEDTGGVVDMLTKDDIFNKNYWDDFQKYLTPEHKKVFKDFSKIGWSDLIKKIQKDKEKNKDVDKTKKKIETEERKSEYAYVILDGIKQKVANFIVEPQGIFYGRGKNPNRGKIKKVVNPEDITINISKDDPVPNPPEGHKWKGIVHNHNDVWLAKWDDSITSRPKYIYFSSEGKFKGESDLVKYENARKLQMNIETVREGYTKDAHSSDRQLMELGTVLYLIDNFGIRVGNETKSDEADTVGASTIRVDHVKLEKPYVIFDFLGKDSVRFYKKLNVPSYIYDNFKTLLSGKPKMTQVFSSISSNDINSYLHKYDKSFSAKVFRTRLGSNIMYHALKKLKVPKDPTKPQIKILFKGANKEVAEVLNHTRSISQKAKEALEKDKQKLKEMKKERKQKKKEGKSVESLDKRIDAKEMKIEEKSSVMNVAINTSLDNYIDPRLVVAWTKKYKIDPSFIYTPSMIKKFKWAYRDYRQEMGLA